MDTKRKPIIGITCRYDYGLGQDISEINKQRLFYIRENYTQILREAGAIPLILPVLDDSDSSRELTDIIDALLLSGGGNDTLIGNKISNAGLDYYIQNPKRTKHKIELTKLALDKDMPILGICLGNQTINVALGGTINNDISANEIEHNQKEKMYTPTHWIGLNTSSMIYHIFNKNMIKVNTSHVQAIDILGKHLKATSYSTDGIIESIESKRHSFVLGVQFHPEYLAKDKNSFYMIFEGLVRASKDYIIERKR